MRRALWASFGICGLLLASACKSDPSAAGPAGAGAGAGVGAAGLGGSAGGGGSAAGSGAGGTTAGSSAGGGAGVGAASGAGGSGGGTFCTKPGVGYHAIGVDLSDHTSPALYLIGKGANDWDAEIGITTLAGQPFAPGYALSGDGSVYYSVGPSGLFTLTLPSLEWAQIGTFQPGPGIDALSPTGNGWFVMSGDNDSLHCYDSNTDTDYEIGALPTPITRAAGIIGSCQPSSSATDPYGTYDVTGVSKADTNQFTFFSAKRVAGMVGGQGTFSAMSDPYLGGAAVGLANNGTVTIGGNSLVSLVGSTPTVVRALQMCVDETSDFYLNGLVPPISGFSD